MQDFRQLEVWRMSHALTLELYRITSGFPREELYGLTSQIRRAASSVSANLAEGCGRGTDADFRRFVQLAMGSACEVEYHILLARDLDFLSSDVHGPLEQQIQSIKRMLTSLIKRLSTNSYSRQPTADSR